MSKLNSMLFYKLYVTKDFRKPIQLSTAKLTLPRGSILHKYTPNGALLPPDTDDIIKHEKRIYVQSIKELKSKVGNPMEVPNPKAISQARKMVFEYDLYKPLAGPVDEVNEHKLVLFNYNLLEHLYRYKKNRFAYYNHYINILGTIVDNMQYARGDYLEIDITGEQLISLADLKRMSQLPREVLATKVRSMYTVFMVEFVNLMLGRTSIFDRLELDDQVTSYFIFRNKTNAIIINLATLLNQLGFVGDKEFSSLARSTFKPVRTSKINKNSVFATTSKFMDGFMILEEEESIPKEEKKEKKIPKAFRDLEKIDAAKKLIEEATPTATIEDDDPISDARAVLESSLATDAPRAEVVKLEKRITKAREVVDPVTETKLSDIKIDDKDIDISAEVIPTDSTLVDEGVRRNKLQAFDNKYIENILHKDTMRMISKFNASGAMVTDVKVETVGSVLGETVEYRISFNPLDGERSTVKFKLPKVEDGAFVANGTKYRMKKQHGDLPIRKIGPYEVNLSSYYGKLSITRSNLAVNSLEKYLYRKINESDKIVAVRGNVFDSYAKTPYIYGVLSMNFRELSVGKIKIHLDYKTRGELLKDSATLEKVEKGGNVLCGTIGKSPLIMDANEVIRKADSPNEEPVGTLYEIFDIAKDKAPLPQAMIRIFGKNIPLVLVYLYHIGMNGILKHFKVKYKVNTKGKRHKDAILKIAFNDVSIGIYKAPPEALLLLNSLVKLKAMVKYLDFKDFNKAQGFQPDAIGYMLTELGHPNRFEKEFALLRQLFIDPITKTILERLNEPTTFIPLLDRSLELLDSASHPSPTDSRFMREKGYERFNGFMYKEIVKAIRSYKTAFNIKKRSVNISEFAVFNAIIKDSTVKPTEDINPLSPIKEQEIITYLGEGGRSKETLVESSRIYHESDVGLLSEAVPDSGTVGINAYLASDNDISDVYGLRKPSDKVTTAGKHSTSFLVTPGVDMDNPIRAVMSHIQQSHVVSMKGAEIPLVRTGAEYVLPSKSSTMFCNIAKTDLTIKTIGKSAILAVDKQGKEHRFPYGIQEGTSEGKVYPHPLITDLKEGDKLKAGDGISWNPYYFEKDDLLDQLVYKSGMAINIAMVEGYNVNEDSFVITKALADKLDSDIRYVRNIVIDFDDSPLEMVKVGDKLAIGDTLMIIEDAITKGMVGKSKQAAVKNTLTDLLRQVPRSTVGGVVAKIEVLYNGLIEDMSPELAKLTKKSNSERRRAAKELGKKGYTGATYGELRIDGKVIEDNQAVIVISIDSHRGLQAGDKFVFGSQLKATLGDILEEPLLTESGDKVYGFFSYKAAKARMAYSGIIVPIATKILRHLPKYLLSKHG